MDEFVGQAPAILAEAAKSALGIFALMIMALSVIGFYFFRESSEKTRVAIFFMMFVGVASFGAATVRSTSPGPGAPPVLKGADVAGEWHAEVTYGWGDHYTETFSFGVHGSRVTGTASYLGLPRGIVDGQLDGNQISFAVQLEELAGGSYKNGYIGSISEDEIRFTLQDSRGNAPVEFSAVRGSSR